MTEHDLDAFLRALPPRPTDVARVESLNVRPGASGEREPRDLIELDPLRGAIGDRWERKTWMYLPDGRPDPRVQIALCNTSLLDLMQRATGIRHHPGDNIFTNLDLSAKNLPVGTRLRVGPAVIEITDVENDACARFASFYGAVVFKWIRRPDNHPLRLRGVYARVLTAGTVRTGDVIEKLPAT